MTVKILLRTGWVIFFKTEGTSGSPWMVDLIGDGRVCFHANQVEAGRICGCKAGKTAERGAIRRWPGRPGSACKMFSADPPLPAFSNPFTRQMTCLLSRRSG